MTSFRPMRVVNTRMPLGAIPCTIQSELFGRAITCLQLLINHRLCCARLPTELKHISKSRNRNQTEISLVAASETETAIPEFELWERCDKQTKRSRMGQAKRCNSGRLLSWAEIVVLLESAVRIRVVFLIQG
jgi:hypothetical protein